MNVRNCRKCGKLFNYVVGLPICPKCRELAEEEFQKVKKYVQENRGCDISEVSEACEVDPQQIRQWIREERLQFADDSPIQIACESCGTMIRSGKFCDKCKAQMTNGLNSVLNAAKKPAMETPSAANNANRMRFIK